MRVSKDRGYLIDLSEGFHGVFGGERLPDELIIATDVKVINTVSSNSIRN